MYRGIAYSAPPAPSLRWRQTSGGDKLAVSLDAIKKWTNRVVEDTFFDDEIYALASAAQRAIERYAQLQLTLGTWVATAPYLTDRIRLVRRPFIDVTGIEYVATDGTITAMPTDLYHALPIDRDAGMVFLGDGLRWPDTANRHDAVRITVRAGYGTTDADEAAGAPPLPDDIFQALQLTIAAFDANHGDEGPQARQSVFVMKNSQAAIAIPRQAVSLLATYRYVSVTAA